VRRLLLMSAVLAAAFSHAIVPAWTGPGSESLVKPITTTIRYADGGQQRNQGAGFVVGTRFYTAFHNIQAAPQQVLTRRIVIGTVSVEPFAIDVEHDLAVFEVPPELCDRWCNDLAIDRFQPTDTAAVAWIRLDGDSQLWKQGQVTNVAFKAPLATDTIGGCEDNLVVEVDKPFIPGSSGGPVFDATSGAIVGIIQGSFTTMNGRVSGYYKPLQCVASRLEMASLTDRATSETGL